MKRTRNGRSAIVIPVTLSAAGPYTQTLIDKGMSLWLSLLLLLLKTLIKFGTAGIEEWLASGAQEIIHECCSKIRRVRGIIKQLNNSFKIYKRPGHDVQAFYIIK